MRFSDVDTRLSEVTAAGAQLVTALGRTGDWWRADCNTTFSPGETLLHIGQATRFNLLIVRNALGEFSGAVRLNEHEAERLADVQGAASDHPSLRSFNLNAARAQLGRYESHIEIGGYLADSFGLVRHHLRLFPPACEQQMISHPLVALQGPAADFLYWQVIEHAIYHYGQVTAMMKMAGYAEVVPHLYVFGQFR